MATTPVDGVAASSLALKPEEQQLPKGRAGLGPPDGWASSLIWLIIVTALVVMLLGGGVVIFLMEVRTPPVDSKVIVGLVTTALGALIGLIAPSPVTSRGR